MRWKREKTYLSWKSIDTIMLTSMVGCSLLVFASLITGICPLGSIFRTAKLASPKLSLRQVVLLGYARSGSSYLGQFVGGQEQAFYSYEPLDALYVSLYGTREGWNCHSDIVYFGNGTERIPSRREIDEVGRYMHNLLNCHTDAFYPEIWLHGFWQKYSQYHTSLRPYTACLWRHGVEQGAFLACQYHLLGKCAKRLNWTAIVSSRGCPVGVLNKRPERTDVAYQQYAACIARLEQRVQPCRRYFNELCTRSRFRVAKTIRMTMEATEGLLENNPDLRIIHLIRDPRAVVYSRSKFDPSTHGLYSGSPMDPVREATAYCSIVRRDIAMRRQLEQIYPGSFLEVLYEEFVADPEALARRIYDFIGIRFDAERQDWLRRTTSSWKGDPEHWKESLPPHVIRTIDRVCEGLYEYIAYN